jgi:hypothetical protein
MWLGVIALAETGARERVPCRDTREGIHGWQHPWLGTASGDLAVPPGMDDRKHTPISPLST